MQRDTSTYTKSLPILKAYIRLWMLCLGFITGADDCEDLINGFGGFCVDDGRRVSPHVTSTAQMKHLHALTIDSSDIYLDEIPGIGEKAAEALEKIGITTVCMGSVSH